MTEISWHPIKRFAALSILALGAACASVQAGPASPFPQVIQQPDGSTFEAVMKGDEFQGWMETADGYTVVQNPASKQFEYAAQGANGALVPSGIPVNSGGSNGLKMAPAQLPPKGLRPPKNTELLNFQHGALESKQLAREVPSASSPAGTSAVTGTWSLTPVQGRKKTLVILVNFVDASMSAGSVDYWNNQVFGTGPSVASYYADNSYGKVSIDAVPTSEPGNPPGMVSVRLASNHPNYGNNYNYTQETSWINAALAAAAQYVNFPALDQNGDGTISIDETFIYFILAGYETSAGSGRSPSIWAHAWGGPGVSVAGKSITHWALNGELLGPTNRMTMGVIAHEAGHAMGGLPDLYDISFNNEGLGIFSLMAGGAWGSRIGEIQGSTPVGMDAWSRQYLGWSNPRTIADGVSAAFYSPFVASDSTVILMNPAKSTSEYWLIENRSPQSWDAGMSSYFGQSWPGGLLIQHIDANIGSKSQNDFNRYNAYSHQGNLAEEPSSSPCSMKSSSGSTRGCPGILFGGSSAPDFLESTLPAARYYSGMGSAMGVYGISAPGLTMSATIRMPSSNLPEFSHYDVSTYVPAAARPYQSYLRIINTGTAPTAVSAARISPTDGGIGYKGVLTAALPPGGATTFSPEQVEAAMGGALAAGDRPRVRIFSSASALELQSFMLQPGGVFDEMSNSQTGTSIPVRTYIPAQEGGYTSALRIVNIDPSTSANVQVAYVAENGNVLGSGPLVSNLASGGSTTLFASDIEARLGQAISKGTRPQLTLTSNANLEVQTFLLQPGGAFTNISSASPASLQTDVRTYVPASNGAYSSFLRVLNRGTSSASVSVARVDGATGAVGPSGLLTASLWAGGARTFSPAEIEAALGTALVGTDRPRIRVTSTQPAEVQSFLLQPGGVFDEMTNAQTGTSVGVRTYIPAQEAGYVSFIRIINPGTTASRVTASLVNGGGQVQGFSELISSMPAGASRTFSSSEIEARIGNAVPGTRPRLVINSSAGALEVQTFLLQPGGAFTNISGGRP